MIHYRFYLLDRVGSFVDVADALCSDDLDALHQAQARLGSAPAIQVWQRGRFVSKIERQASA